MLQRLKIENYALIRQMDIPFEKGFISITGETGAGKSIMLGALGLILGQRADANVLWDKEKKCVVEAEFELDNSFVQFFEENDLDFSTQTIFRREISVNGKSRAFINDIPVQLTLMKELGDNLMDIHSQHNTLTLKNSTFQFSIVDSYIDKKELFTDYHNHYSSWRKIVNRIVELETKEAEFQKEASYFQFLSDEFETAKLNIGEQEELEQEVELLSNAEEIKTNIVQSINLLDNDEALGSINLIQQAKQGLSKVSTHHKGLENLYNRLDSSFIELRDIISELINLDDSIILDSQKLEDSQERLDLIYNLEKKHQVTTLEELLKVRDEIDEKLLLSSNLTDEITKLKKEERDIFSKLSLLAKEITKKRKESSLKIEKEILPLLCDMGMKEAVLKINIIENDSLSNNGENDIELLFNANRGGELSPISKVISGGELSRLMLALKAVMSKKQSMPTIIFDEIDTGVSGDIASKVGSIMREMSKNHQIIAITHLPQIAAKSNYHFKVLKNTTEDSTFSEMKLLNPNERVNEIATIISNGSITDSALNLAKELLS
ncbi:MAG: DNA repair protein RecN [Bacteroidales bacterium]|jgi:DNA repair protein RecN (Recombination protein N)